MPSEAVAEIRRRSNNNINTQTHLQANRSVNHAGITTQSNKSLSAAAASVATNVAQHSAHIMSQYFDLDKRQNVPYANDCSSTSGYSSANSPSSAASMTLSPAHSPETLALQNEFANLNLPVASANSPLQYLSSPYHQPQQQPNQLICIDGSNLLSGSNVANFGNMNMDHRYFAARPSPPAAVASSSSVAAYGQMNAHAASARPAAAASSKSEYPAVLCVAEQPVEKFRFRYKSEMHGTHGSLNGINSKRTPKTFPEVVLQKYEGPAVIRCSLFQTNLDSPHSHQLVVRKDERDVCDPHDLHVSSERGYVAQFINMGIIHTAKKYIFDELLKKKQDRLVFQMGRRELSTKQIQELHHETEREAKDMNLNQVRLCFEAFKIEDNGIWTAIAAPVFSNPINNRKSAQTGELRIVRLSKPTGGVMGNDELILLVEKVSKKNIKVRFFEENEDGETVWEAYAKFRESDVHHQYAIVCQTPAYKDKDVEREVGVSIELIRPSDDERSYPPLPFRYKPREAIVSRKRRRTCSTATSSSGGTGSSASNSLELPKTVQQHGQHGHVMASLHDQTISQEFGRDLHLNELIGSESFQKLVVQDSAELEKWCGIMAFDHLTDVAVGGEVQQDGHAQPASSDKSSNSSGNNNSGNSSSSYLGEIFKIYEAARRGGSSSEHFQAMRKKVEELFTAHAVNNYNNDTLLHEVISQKHDNLKLAIKTFQVMSYFQLQELANSALNADGDSGLHVACQQDRAHYIRPLLGLGCSPTNQNHGGNTALHLAVKEERINCVESFLNGPAVKLDLTLKNDDGLTPLHMAIRQNKYDVAKKLINHDRSSINVPNTKDGNNALHMAVLEKNVELLVLILDAQNLTDILLARNAAGYTPLELARSKANERCVRLLEEVYPDRGELAMTWIPLNVKEEMDSSSAEDDDESSETTTTERTDLKSEEIDIKVEEEEQQSSGKTHDLELLLSDKTKFDRLAAALNEPFDQDPAMPKWKQLAKESKMQHLVFLWSNAEGMLGYIQHKSSTIESTSFANALQAVDFKAFDILTQH